MLLQSTVLRLLRSLLIVSASVAVTWLTFKLLDALARQAGAGDQRPPGTGG